MKTLSLKHTNFIVGDRSPVEHLLEEAVGWWDAKFSIDNENLVVNRGTGGSALNAQYGSALGAYIKDEAVVLPGINANGLSTPDLASYTPTTELDVRAGAALTDWTNGATQTLLAHYSTSGSNRSWALTINSSGNPAVINSADGSSAPTVNCTVALGATDNSPICVRAVWESTTPSISFYWKPWVSAADLALDTGWTLLSTETSSVVASFYNPSAPLTVGYIDSAGLPATGSVLAAKAIVNGVAVYDVDLANVADYATSFTATTGQTVTVNSTSSDTGDPLLLLHTGENYAYLPSGAANDVSISSAQAATYTVSGDVLDIRVEAALPDWLAAGAKSLFSCAVWNVSGYEIYIDGGTLGFLGKNATDQSLATSTVDVSFAANERGWVRATKSATNGDVKFYTSTDGTTWTQLGATVAKTAAAHTAPTQRLGFSRVTSQTWAGKAFRAMVLDDSTVKVDINFNKDVANSSATSFIATSGQTVAVNRATSGRKTALVTRSIWLLGTDDYLEVADNDLLDFGASDEFSVMMVYRVWETQGSSWRFLQKQVNDSSTGYYVANWGTQPNFGTVDAVNGFEGPVVGTDAYGDLMTVVGRRTTTSVYTNVNDVSGVSVISPGPAQDLSNTAPLRIGKGQSSNYDIEVVAAAIWRRELTTDEIAALNSYYNPTSIFDQDGLLVDQDGTYMLDTDNDFIYDTL